jgi:hypothetical protein
VGENMCLWKACFIQPIVSVNQITFHQKCLILVGFNCPMADVKESLLNWVVAKNYNVFKSLPPNRILKLAFFQSTALLNGFLQSKV